MIKFCVLKVLKNRHLQWHLTATGLVTLVLNFLVFPVILKNVVHSPHYHASLSGKEEWRYLMNHTKFCHDKALAYWMNQSQNIHDLSKGFPSWHRGPERYPGVVQCTAMKQYCWRKGVTWLPYLFIDLRIKTSKTEVLQTPSATEVNLAQG